MTTLAVPEATQPKVALSFKTAQTLEAPVDSLTEVRPDEGIVTAIVSITGTRDDVDDVIEPGAYKRTLAKRRPKVCWNHSWEAMIGRVMHVEEIMPGDHRLPPTARDGKAWPREAGAVVATMQFNMKSDRGREAFEAVRFYSETGECEWSIGYIATKAKVDSKGIRHISELECFEFSVVLFGAHNQTGTLSLKDAVAAMHERTDVEPDVAKMHALGMAEVDWEEVDAAPQTDPADGEPLFPAETKRDLTPEQRRKKPTLPGTDEGWPIGDKTDLQAAINSYGRAKPDDRDKVKRWIVRRARELDAISMLPDKWGVKKSSPGAGTRALAAALEAKAAGGADRNRGNAENLRRWYVSGEGALKIRWGTDGDFMRCVHIAEKHMDPERARGYCNLRHQDAVGAPPGQGHPDGKALADHYDPQIEVKMPTFAATIEGKSFPTLPGTFEDRMASIRAAATTSLIPEPDGEDGKPCSKHVSVDGTYPDYVVVTLHDWSDVNDQPQSFRFGYRVHEDGEIELTDPEKVVLTAVVEHDANDEPQQGERETYLIGDVTPMVDMAELLYKGVSSILTGVEGKAGRVLSGANEAALRASVENLLGVLARAGVTVDNPNASPAAATQDTTDTETTAPAANVEGKVLTAADLDATLAELSVATP